MRGYTQEWGSASRDSLIGLCPLHRQAPLNISHLARHVPHAGQTWVLVRVVVFSCLCRAILTAKVASHTHHLRRLRLCLSVSRAQLWALSWTGAYLLSLPD